jgi:hypothetical integral membrane protein (TIGR02206 family)
MDTFRPFTLTHGAVVLAFILLVTATFVARRSRRATPAGDMLDRRVGLLAVIAFVITNAWPLMPFHFRLDWSLPLHGCDVTTLCVPIAILTNWRPARALVYFWGLGLSTQGFITPDLQDGPARMGFWTFWLAHFFVVGGALYDVARGFRPTWRDYRFVLGVSVAYVALILPLDLVLGVNYGYLGPAKSDQPTIVDALGPWPWRVGIMFALGAGAMALLMVPWEIARCLRPSRVRGAAEPRNS